MNRYIFFGIPFLFFGIEFLVLDNNTITSSNPTTTVNIFSQKTLNKTTMIEVILLICSILIIFP